MFVVLLEFSANRSSAGEHMEGHRAWIQRGIDEGVFLLVGGLVPDGGGGILAHETTRADLERRVNEDPFVVEDVVSAVIVEIAPARADERLAFLMS